MRLVALDTESYVPWASNGDSSLISLFLHSLSISHVNKLSTLLIRPFISTDYGAMINHLQSKYKKKQISPPGFQRTQTGEKNNLPCLWVRRSITTEWRFYSLLFTIKVQRHRSVMLPCCSLDTSQTARLTCNASLQVLWSCCSRTRSKKFTLSN